MVVLAHDRIDLLDFIQHAAEFQRESAKEGWRVLDRQGDTADRSLDRSVVHVRCVTKSCKLCSIHQKDIDMAKKPTPLAASEAQPQYKIEYREIQPYGTLKSLPLALEDNARK